MPNPRLRAEPQQWPPPVGEMPEFNQLLFQSRHVTIGRFHARRSHPRFRDSGPIQLPTIVFPRTSVRIRHCGGPAFVADRTVAPAYNGGQEYERSTVADQDDLCDWFVFAPEHLGEAFGSSGNGDTDPTHPFRDPFVRLSGGAFRWERELVRSLEAEDADRVDESALGLLDCLVRGATRPLGTRRGYRSHRDLAESVRELLAGRFAERLPVDEIAAFVHCSPYHLCRVFRRETGTTIHAHRTELRLRHGVERLLDGGEDVSTIAHGLGFSSHAHFTAAFRRAFGETPSAVRRHRSVPLRSPA